MTEGARQAPATLTVAFINTVMVNTGDAAILEGAVEALNDANARPVRAVLFDSHAEPTGRLYPHHEVHPMVAQRLRDLPRTRFRRRLVHLLRLIIAAALWRLAPLVGGWFLSAEERPSFRALSNCDAVISTGGTYLVPQYDLLVRGVELILARVLCGGLVLYTQNVGHVQPGLERCALIVGLRGVRLALVRDEMSKQNLRRLGVRNERIYLAPDAAFALTPPPASSPDGDIAVSVRKWSHFERGSRSGMEEYEEAVADAVTYVVSELGRDVVFISSCQGVSDYPDDAAVARRIVGRLDDAIAAHVLVEDDHHTPLELMRFLARMHLVIATRLHVAILAMVARVPTVAVAYESKTYAVFEKLGRADLVVDIESLEGEDLIARIESALDEHGEMQRRVGDFVSQARSEAHNAASLALMSLENLNA